MSETFFKKKRQLYITPRRAASVHNYQGSHLATDYDPLTVNKSFSPLEIGGEIHYIKSLENR